MTGALIPGSFRDAIGMNIPVEDTIVGQQLGKLGIYRSRLSGVFVDDGPEPDVDPASVAAVLDVLDREGVERVYLKGLDTLVGGGELTELGKVWADFFHTYGDMTRRSVITLVMKTRAAETRAAEQTPGVSELRQQLAVAQSDKARAMALLDQARAILRPEVPNEPSPGQDGRLVVPAVPLEILRGEAPDLRGAGETDGSDILKVTNPNRPDMLSTATL